jgi:cardiolipin synthase
MWVDATVRVQGPAAQALGVTFLRDWLLDSDEDITDVVCFLPDIGVPAQDEVLVQLVPSGPGATPLAIHQALLTLIYSAREELIMTTPYFVPDEAMFEALLAAATRGVDVRLIMPTVSDSHLVAAAARAHYEQMLEGGIRIFQYNGGLLHAKTVTVDRNVALIGSTNFDHRSFFLNFEATMFIYDDDFASILRFMQVGYMESAESISLEEWRRRSVWERARDNCAKLMGPLL